MPRKAQPWFRWYVEAFGDRKLRRLTPAQRWLFVAMCGAGKESPELGRLLVAPGLAMTDAEVAEYADVPLRDVSKALPVMDALGMVRRDAEGVLVVLNLHHRQYASDTSAARTADYRERKVSDGVVTSQRRHHDRHSDVRSDVPETETETETEEHPPSLRSGPPRGRREPSKRGTRLPEGWDPPAQVVAEMRLEFPDLTPDQWRSLHAEFRDYWRSTTRNATKLDWPATWRNSIRRNAPRFRTPQQRRLPGYSGDIDWEQAERDALALDQMRGLTP